MTTATALPCLIAVDWGTTAFRAWLVDRTGGVLDQRAEPAGIQAVRGRFGEVLERAVAAWPKSLPILMAGMVGSPQGWVEAPYVSCPAGLATLAGALHPAPVSDRRVFIVPGVRAGALPDPEVMRGEETQVVGAAERTGLRDGVIVLPGTHSKWVTLRAGEIVSLATYMTGEIYAACRDHTILGRLMTDAAPMAEAFAAGVREGAVGGSPGELLNRLFRVRTAGLFGRYSSAALPDYLSGLLIGAELAAGAAARPVGTIQIVASTALAERYAHAAQTLGIDAATINSDALIEGFLRIARQAGLIAAGE